MDRRRRDPRRFLGVWRKPASKPAVMQQLSLAISFGLVFYFRIPFARSLHSSQVGNVISFLWFHVKSASWLTPRTSDLCCVYKGEWQQVICFIAVAPSTCATNKQAIERA